MKITTDFLKLETKSKSFDLIAIQSKLVEKTQNTIDCSKIIESKTRANFNEKYGDVPKDNVLWYSSIEGDTYDALVIIMNN